VDVPNSDPLWSRHRLTALVPWKQSLVGGRLRQRSEPISRHRRRDVLETVLVIIIITTIIIITIPGRCLWCCHREQVTATMHPVHQTNVGQRQAAADPQTRPTKDLGL